MTLIQLVTKSLVAIGAVNPDEVQTASETQNAVDFLNALVDLWAASGLLVYSSTRESFPLVATQSSYTWGTSGGADFATQRPTKITNVFVRDGADDYPCDIIDQVTYDSINDKTNSGRPFAVYPNPTFPLYTLLFYFTPDQTYTLFIDSEKDMIDFADFTAEILLPPEYQTALIWNLARDLCPGYLKAVPPTVEKNAHDSLLILKRLNASNKLKPVRQNLFPGRAGAIWLYGDIQGGLATD